jgi:hypothetical protein
VHYADTGHYQILFVATDSLNNKDTIIENLYVPFCDSSINRSGQMERKKYPKLKIYPNPTSGIFNIEFNSTEPPKECMIFNFLGELVQRKESFNSKQIDLTENPSGVYNILFIFTDRIETQKIIKQ